MTTAKHVLPDELLVAPPPSRLEDLLEFSNLPLPDKVFLSACGIRWASQLSASTREIPPTSLRPNRILVSVVSTSNRIWLLSASLVSILAALTFTTPTQPNGSPQSSAEHQHLQIRAQAPLHLKLVQTPLNIPIRLKVVGPLEPLPLPGIIPTNSTDDLIQVGLLELPTIEVDPRTQVKPEPLKVVPRITGVEVDKDGRSNYFRGGSDGTSGGIDYSFRMVENSRTGADK